MVQAQGRGRAGGARSRPGGAPGGQWSPRTHSGRQSHGGINHSPDRTGGRREGEANRGSSAAGADGVQRRGPNASAKQGAVSNRRPSTTTGEPSAAASSTNASSAAAGAAAANRNPAALSGATDHYAGVRTSLDNPNLYGGHWYSDHPGAWTATGWAAGQAWAPSTWSAVSTHLGYGNAAPITYDYGVNVVSQNGNVLVNGQNVGTNEQYSQQAADLAASGASAATGDSDQWLPLGVFGMVKDETQHAHLIVQLAVNQQGILRGNYTDELTDHTLPIQGAVDKSTQRAAWTVGTNKSTFMEAGLNDLTQAEAPALIHRNGQSDHWILVRLAQPPADSGESAHPPSAP